MVQQQLIRMKLLLKNIVIFFASFQSGTLITGQLLASFILFILALYLHEDQLKSWSWRLPFVIGGCGAVVAIYLRCSLHETKTEETRAHKKVVVW